MPTGGAGSSSSARGSSRSGCAPGCFPAPARPTARRPRRGLHGAAATRQSLPPAAYGRALAEPRADPVAEPSSAGSAKLAKKTKKRRSARPTIRGQPGPLPPPQRPPARRARLPARRHRAQPVHQPGELRQGARPDSASTPSQPRPPRCTLTYGAGAVQVIVTQPRSRGVGLGGVQPAGRQEGPVHARRAAGADADLEPQGGEARRAARARCPPASREPSRRSR